MKYLRKSHSLIFIALGLSALCAMPSFAQSERTPQQKPPQQYQRDANKNVKAQEIKRQDSTSHQTYRQTDAKHPGHATQSTQQPRYQAPPNKQQNYKAHSQPQKASLRPEYRQPPRNMNALRRDVTSQRQYIGRGIDRPRDVKIYRGKPIPKGYTRRLSYDEYRHLPRYQGYEWHSTGRDLILVAISTGIAYAILDNVLN